MTRRAALLLGALATAGAPLAHAADAGAPPTHQLTKSELKRYRAIMAEAVRAAKQGKHAAAIAAYDRALAIKPNDAAALTDEGWSAFLLHDLDRAESITRRAIAAGGEARRTAAAYYNLGRILEGRGDRKGAVAAYVQSLAYRPTRTVREQLAKLDPAAAAEADPLKPVPMLGPFQRLEEFCKTAGNADLDPCPAPARGSALKEMGDPYRDVVWIQAGDSNINARCFVALRLAQGWFVSDRGESCSSDAESEWSPVSFEVKDLVPNGNREILFRSQTQTNDLWTNQEGYMRSQAKRCEAQLVACGVPAKGSPSCIYMQTGSASSYCGDRDDAWDWRLDPVFTPDGYVDVKATGNPDADARLLLGRRPLAFPRMAR